MTPNYRTAGSARCNRSECGTCFSPPLFSQRNKARNNTTQAESLRHLNPRATHCHYPAFSLGRPGGQAALYRAEAAIDVDAGGQTL